MKISTFSHRYLLLLMFFMLCLNVFAVRAQETYGSPGQAPMSKEYFIRQGAEEHLFIRVNTFEAEFESRVFAPDEKLIITSELAHSSLAPVFQFVPASGEERQLDIKVSSNHYSNRAAFELGLSRITVNDQRSGMLAQAYQSVSIGLQKEKKLTSAGWSVKVGSLLNAGRVFEQFGMVEMRLWTLYFAAHLLQYQLNDFNSTLDFADQILAVVKDSPFRLLELASLQLKSAALTELQSSNRLDDPNAPTLDAVLSEQVILAGLLDHQYEEAWALFFKASLSADRQLYRQALEQFNGALELAVQLQADSLARQTRENIVAIHDMQGNTQASVEVLREIEGQLEAQAGNELAENLLQQGRLLNTNFHFPEAIRVLSQALDHQNNSMTRGQIKDELAKALHENGQEKEAFAVLADEPELVKRELKPKTDEAIQAMVVPRYSVQRAVRRSQILVDNGRPLEALEVLEKVIADIHFYQQTLPGVLGNWYWSNKDSVFSSYLDLTRTQGKDPKRSLLALSKIRYIELAEAQQSELTGKAPTTGMEALRSLIARFQHSPETITEQDRGLLTGQIAEMRRSFDQSYAWLSQSTLQQYLAGLGENKGLLTYYFGPQETVAWLGDQNGVREFVLPHQGEISQLIDEFQSHRALQSGAHPFESNKNIELLDQLGQSLIAPLKDHLSETIYWIPPGQLMDLPLDALRLDGRYLAEAHRVVNVMSFPATTPARLAISVPPYNVFVAGFPQDFRAQYATQLESTAEIGSVADYFLGPGLTILQGNALLQEEFQLENFRTADLIHLSMPGLNNLSDPSRSHLQLSEVRPGQGRVKLQMSDFEDQNLKAKLVFLSATRYLTTGSGKGPYRPGLVTALLDAGAHAVVAGMWSGDDQFVEEFYRNLLQFEDISTALAQSKREMIETGPDQHGNNWSRYQLYIR